MEASEKTEIVRERLNNLLPSGVEWRVVAEKENPYDDNEKVMVQVAGAHLNTKKWYDADTSDDTIAMDVATLCDKVNNR